MTCLHVLEIFASFRNRKINTGVLRYMEIDMAFLRLLLSSSLIFAAFINKNVIADNLYDGEITPCFPDDIIPMDYYNIKVVLHTEGYTNNNHNNNYNTSDCRAPFYSYTDDDDDDDETVRINGGLTFHGQASVLVNITRSTRNIKLRLRQSQINLSTIILMNLHETEYEIQPQKYDYDYDAQTCSLYYQDEVKQGLYMLNTTFEGIMGRDLPGLFATSYLVTSGSKKWLIVSEFQTLTTQLIFPCLDQPKLKINFNIALKDNGYVIVSNKYEGIKETRFKNGMISWQYSIPPVSPNYFMIAARNDFVETYQNRDGIVLWYRLRIYYDVIHFIWTFITNIPYKLKENWYIIEDTKNFNKIHFIIPGFRDNGLKTRDMVLYSETNIVYRQELDHPVKRMQIAQLITRKLLRQYFGDTSCWLMDGLITLMEVYTTNELLPEYRISDLFVVQKQHESLHLDYYFNGEAIEDKHSKINSSPYYNKAPFFLRMLQYLITHEVFREGVHKYINKHASNSTIVSKNLWAAMQDALREKLNLENEYKENIDNLTSLMIGWLKQKHYPLVTITRNVDGTVSMQLESYIPTNMRDILLIPVTFTSQSHPNFDRTSFKNVKWISCVSKNWPITKLPLYFEENGWIIANLKQAGYYRVNYDSENWDKIANYLNSSEYTKIHVLNRAQIIDDSFHLAIQGLQNYSLFWKITSYLSRETDYIAWYPMFKALEYISSIFPFEYEKRVQDIKDFLNKIFDDLFMKLKYTTAVDSNIDDELTKYLKQEATRWACTLNHEECLIQAKNKLRQHIRESSGIPMYNWEREWTFCQGLKTADIYLFNEAARTLLNSNDSKNRYHSENLHTRFFTCVQNIPIDNEFFEYIKWFRYNAKPDENRISIFYSVITRHVKNAKELDFILSQFYKIKPSQISTEAALIVIINSMYSDEAHEKILSYMIVDKNINRCLKHKIVSKLKLREFQIKNQKNYLLRLKFAENIIYNNNIDGKRD